MKIKELCMVLLLIISVISYAQIPNTNLNSSAQVENIDALLIATEDIGTSSPQKFNNIIEKLKINKNLDPHQKDFLKYLIYYQQGYNGEFEKSAKNFETLFNKSRFDDIKFRAQTKIVNINAIQGNIPKALKALDYILKFIPSLKDQRLKKIGYKVANIFYFLVNEDELSQNFSELILGNNPTKSEYCQAQANVIRIKIRSSKSVAQLNNKIIQAISNCEIIGDYVYSNLIRVDWLKALLNVTSSTEDDYLFVLEQLKSSENQIDTTHYKNLINIKDSLFAQVYWKLKQSKKALYYANKVLNEKMIKGATLQKIETLQVLIDYHKNINEFQKAFEFSLKKNKTEKAHFNQEKSKIMAYQTAKHQLMAKTQEINYLNQKNELLSHEKDLIDKADKYQKLLIASLSIIAILILLWALRSNKIQKVYKKLSERDHMTLIYNRKGLKEYMDNLLPHAEKKQEVIAYAIFDLDYFKNINDTYGHVSGDWVIKKVIKECQAINNDKVTFGRIGGEEFAIVMHHSTKQELSEFSEQCRLKIAEIDTIPCGYDFNITASFGVTSTDQSGYVYSQLMTHADQAMYDAKIAGRNMVVQYQKAA